MADKKVQIMVKECVVLYVVKYNVKFIKPIMETHLYSSLYIACIIFANTNYK